MRVLSKLLIIFCGFGFLALMGFYAYEQGWARLAPVEFELAKESTEKILFERIKKSLPESFINLEGDWLWDIQLKEIHARLVADPRIKTVQISRLFPNRIRATVWPHKPVFGLLDTKGKLHPVATDGSLLPALKFNEAPDFPVLRGLQFFDDESLRIQAVSIFRQVPEEGAFSQKNISEVRHSRREGFRFYLVNPSVQVLIGDAEVGRKASRIEKVLRYIESRRLRGRVIDARLSKKVVVRVRNEP